MEHPTAGSLGTVISSISAAVTVVTANLNEYVSLTAGMVAIASGCMAIRHYYYSTKKLKGGKND